MKKKQILFGLFLMQTMSVMLFAEPMEYSSTDDKENRIAKFLQEPLPEDVEVSRQKVTKDQSVETALQQIADLRTKVLAQAAITNLFNVVSKNWKKSAKESYYLAYHDKCEGFCISQDTLSELVNDMRMKKNLPKIDFNVTTSVGKLNLPKTSSEVPTAIAKEVGKLPKVEEPAPVLQPAVEPVVVAPSSQDKGDADLVAFYQLKLPQDVVYKNAADEKVFEVGKGTKVFDLLNYLAHAMRVDDTDESDVKEFLKNFVVSMSPNKGVTSDKLFNTVKELKLLNVPLKKELTAWEIADAIKLIREDEGTSLNDRILVAFYKEKLPTAMVYNNPSKEESFEVEAGAKVMQFLQKLAVGLARHVINEQQITLVLNNFIKEMTQYFLKTTKPESFENHMMSKITVERLLKTVKELASLREDVAGQEQKAAPYDLNDSAEVRQLKFLNEKLKEGLSIIIRQENEGKIRVVDGFQTSANNTVMQALRKLKFLNIHDVYLDGKGNYIYLGRKDKNAKGATIQEMYTAILKQIKTWWPKDSLFYRYYFGSNQYCPDGCITVDFLLGLEKTLEPLAPAGMKGDLIPVEQAEEQLLPKNFIREYVLSGSLMTQEEKSEIEDYIQDAELSVERITNYLKTLEALKTTDQKISYFMKQLGRSEEDINDLLTNYTVQQRNNVVSNIILFIQISLQMADGQ